MKEYIMGECLQIPAWYSWDTPLWLPHLPRCPCVIGTRLCKWKPDDEDNGSSVLEDAPSEVPLCTVLKLLPERKKDEVLS